MIRSVTVLRAAEECIRREKEVAISGFHSPRTPEVTLHMLASVQCLFLPIPPGPLALLNAAQVKCAVGPR